MTTSTVKFKSNLNSQSNDCNPIGTDICPRADNMKNLRHQIATNAALWVALVSHLR